MRQILCLVLFVVLMNGLQHTTLAQDDPNCPGAPLPRLAAGGYAQVAPGDPNNMRDQPSRTGSRVGQIPGGETFSVLDGPVCADGFNWWQVDYNGQTGWTVEGTGGDYFVAPFDPTAPTATPTETPAPTATPGPVMNFTPPLPYDNQLVIGARVRIIDDGGGSDPLQLRMHTDPGISTQVTGVVLEDAIVTIEDGPQEADGLRWWLIRTEDNRRGWVIEGQGDPNPDAYLPYQRTLLPLCTTTDGDRISFIARQHVGQYRFQFLGYLYTANLDGSSPCIYDRLKLSPVYTTWGELAYEIWRTFPSPDGQQIAYIDQPDHDFVLYTLSMEGIRQSVTENGSGSVYAVDWTPDGSRLLYTLRGDVWTQRPNGSARGAITRDEHSHTWAAWLGDSDSLVYSEDHGAAIQMHGPTQTIVWRISVTAGGLRKLVELTDDVRDLQVSPDGRYVLITGFTQQLEPWVEINGSHTLVLDAFTGETVYEVADVYYDAFWSRDSQSIIYPPHGMPDQDTPGPMVLDRIPVLGGEPLSVETGLTEPYTILRWLDDDNLLIITDSNALTVLNVRTGAVTPAADFSMS